MQKYFIPHKLKLGDITHLSDNDSELVISQNKLNIEDLVEIETYEKVFIGQITDIAKTSVEIEIVEDKGERISKVQPSITIIQSLSNDSKFNYFLEKSVEIGIGRIIPVESKYSLKNKNKALKNFGLWNKIVKDATEQSRNPYPPILEKPIKIKELNSNDFKDTVNICLATENVNPTFLDEYLKTIDIDKDIVIAIGPEKGWSSSDIKIFKESNFKFVKLRGNILRTETAGLVIGSIIKYLKGEI
ncbi:MAG: RsmE family RNA methyltransferase [Candidatus Dojkabacteria bacterium]|nr:RsmE family RNA methyltransferase [Candidatus Dojkabacteria bacterium]